MTYQQTFEPEWAADEAAATARRRLTAERCRLMESALAASGFRRGSLYWIVGVMLAKISDGWQTFSRELALLSDDAEFRAASGSSESRHRKRSMRRCLAELEAAGLLTHRYVTHRTPRRTRTPSVVEIQWDRRRLDAIIDGIEPPDPTVTDAGQMEDKTGTEVVTKPGQNRDRSCDKTGTKPGQNANHSLYAPYPIPKEPSPPPGEAAAACEFKTCQPQGASPDCFAGEEAELRGRHSQAELGNDELTPEEVVCVFLRLGVVRAAPLVQAAIDRGCSLRSLVAISRWYERSQRLNPRRWRDPPTVLMIRLEKSHPKLPAWSAWIPGEPPPRRRVQPRSRSPDEFAAARLRARESVAEELPMAEQLKRAMHVGRTSQSVE
jgi:hypothetical protein